MSVLYSSAVSITPSDTAEHDIDGFYVGGAGNVAVTTSRGQVVTFTAPPIGTVINLRCKRIMATNTTATLIIGLKR